MSDVWNTDERNAEWETPLIYASTTEASKGVTCGISYMWVFAHCINLHQTHVINCSVQTFILTSSSWTQPSRVNM